METNIVVDIWPPIPYLGKFWFSSYGPKCCQPIKLQDSWKCYISRKKWMIKFIFGMQINIEALYKLIYHFGCVQPVMPKVPKIRSLHIQKCMGSEVNFFCLQLNMKVFNELIITLGLRSQVCPKHPKQVYNIFVTSQGKREGWTWSFAYI